MIHQGLVRLASIATVVSFLLVGLLTLAPTAAAESEVGVLAPCNYPGYQDRLVMVKTPYDVNSEWRGREYHVYGYMWKDSVWTYNWDTPAGCVGAVNHRYEGNEAYDYCMNCIYVEGDVHLLA